MQEADSILEGAEHDNIAFLIVGDPFGPVSPQNHVAWILTPDIGWSPKSVILRPLLNSGQYHSTWGRIQVFSYMSEDLAPLALQNGWSFSETPKRPTLNLQ